MISPVRPWIDPAVPAEVQKAAQRLAGQLELHPLVAQILAHRGYTDLESARAFLDPSAYRPAPAEALPGVPAAVARLLQALEAGETILVWGDFDVDGQTATALLVGVLGDLGGRVRFHIPVRAVESHGVGLPALRRVLEEAPAPQVLLTCDTGIADFESLAAARSAGVAVIVTDHHALVRPPAGPAAEVGGDAPGVGDGPSYRLPPADIVVTPRLLPDDHPLAGLPGVGVAYTLVEALCARLGRPELVEAQLDLVALGIVADVARQTGDTRYLLQRGLYQLNHTRRAGLLAVFEQAGLQAGRLGEDDIGFALAPRLNALGRLSDANPAVELLTTTDAGRARVLAVHLEGFNARRQLLTSHTLQGAQALIARQPEALRLPVLVLAQPAWEPGVIGIVASRLVELYARPVVLFAAPPGQPARGSARSVEGIDITAAIATAAATSQAPVEPIPGGPSAPLVKAFGGHPMAAGLSLPAENIPEFTRRLAQAVQAQRALLPAADAATGQPLFIDAYLPWQALDLALVDALERLGPFGPGNPAPVLASRDLRLVGRSVVGRNRQHLALSLADEAGLKRRVMWWGGAETAGLPATAPDGGKAGGGGGHAAGETEPLAAVLPDQASLDLAYTLRRGALEAAGEVRIEWVDGRVRPVEPAAPAGPQVVDLRRSEHALEALRAWLVQAGCLGDGAAGPADDWQVWAEADAPQKLAARFDDWLGGPAGAARLRQRYQLSPCHTLVVWTTPPGRGELLAALALTQAQRVVLVGVPPSFTTPQPFLERLAGLVKYALAAEAGALDLERLAAALAQRTRSVRSGLAWLAAQGAITLQEPGPQHAARPGVWLASAGGVVDARQAAGLFQEVQQALDETQAYRAHFLRRSDVGFF